MNYFVFKISIIIFIFRFNAAFPAPVNNNNNSPIIPDSILLKLKKADTKSLPFATRQSLIDSVYFFSIQSGNDSLRNKALKKYVKLYYQKREWELFNKFRMEHLHLAEKLKDSLSYAKTLESSGAFFMLNHKTDSAYYYYYKSFKVFDNLKDSLNAGRVLVNLAILQRTSHDYNGSEMTSLKAINYLKHSNYTRRISSIYNNLGVIYGLLDDIKNSIKYHKKALELRKKLKATPIYQLQSLNNIGLAYIQNHEYEKAKTYFEKALLFDSIIQNNPTLKAYIIDNHTYACFKTGKTTGVKESFLEALAIREKKNDLNGIIINCIHLAEYHNKTGDRQTALVYAQRAEKMSESIHNYEDYLRSIELVCSLQNTREAQNAHLKKYIAIRDSLDKIGKNNISQLAKIRFELERKNATIKKQNLEIKKKQNTIWRTFGVLLLVIAIIVFLYFRKWNIKKELQKKFMKGFKQYLVKKYSLTPENLAFWDALASGLDQNQISEKLFISIEAIKSRRRSLKNKIEKVEKIKGNFDKTKAVILYNKEMESYKTHISKKGQ